jgi:hypothetical protein
VGGGLASLDWPDVGRVPSCAPARWGQPRITAKQRITLDPYHVNSKPCVPSLHRKHREPCSTGQTITYWLMRLMRPRAVLPGVKPTASLYPLSTNHEEGDSFTR